MKMRVLNKVAHLQLGVKDIFNPKKSGIYNILKTHENVFVSAAKQKAFVEVNEEGSEATAANGKS